MAKEQEIGAYSAYAIAVEHGYIGTEEDWIKEQERNRKASEQAASDAESAKTAAEKAQKAAESSAGGAAGEAQKAQESREQAASSAAQAGEAQKAAESAKSAAAVSASLAQESAAQAAGSAESADSAKTAAAQSEQRTAASEANVAQAEERINKTVSGAVEAVAAQETKSVQAVSAQGEASVAAVTAEGERVLGTIPEDYTAAVREIDALKDSKAEIDDTAIDGDTWSSKHIVDMLCPKIEKSGTVVQMDRMLGEYPLGVKVSWTPTQEGSGDPSPENIRPIQGRDSVTIERAGGNLLNPALNSYTPYTPYGLTITYIGDNRIRLEGTYEGTTGSSFGVLNTQQNRIAGKGLKITGFTVGGTEQRYTLYGLRSKAETVIAMTAMFSNGDVIDMTVAIVVSQETPSAYAPYIGQATTLTLPSAVYGGEVNAEGKGQETWGYMDSYAGETLPAEWICDRAAYAVGTTPPNGAQVAYKLDNPKSFTATGGAAIKALSGTNTVLTDADSVTATGRADPIQTVAKLNDRIAALEAAATNITE